MIAKIWKKKFSRNSVFISKWSICWPLEKHSNFTLNYNRFLGAALITLIIEVNTFAKREDKPHRKEFTSAM